MKSLSLFFATICMILFVQSVNAQNIGNIMKKALKEAEKAITEEIIENETEEQKTESEEKQEEVVETEQSEEEVEVNENSSNSEQDVQNTQAMFNMMGMGAEIPTKDNYSFSSNIKMEMKSFDANGESDGPVYYESFFNPNQKTYAMKFTSENEQSSEGMMIFDYENKAMIIINNENGNKSGMVTSIDVDATVEEDLDEVEDSDAFAHLKKTGASKKVLGYKCDEYQYKNEEGKVSYWFTKDIDFFDSNLWGGFEQLAMFFTGQMPNGMLMEMESENFTTNEKFNLLVKEINKNVSKNIDLKDYQLISIGGMENTE